MKVLSSRASHSLEAGGKSGDLPAISDLNLAVLITGYD